MNFQFILRKINNIFHILQIVLRSFVLSKLCLLFINQLGRFDDVNSSWIFSGKMKNDEPKSSDDESKSPSHESTLTNNKSKGFLTNVLENLEHSRTMLKLLNFLKIFFNAR